MSEKEDLLKLAKMADERGDTETAKKALQKLDTLGGSASNELAITGTRPFELTARHGAEGWGELADIVTNPIRHMLNQQLNIEREYLPNIGDNDSGFNTSTSQGVSTLLDQTGLAKPETTGEKIVGRAAKTMSAGVPFLKLGGLLSQSAKPVSKAVGDILSSQPALQLTSAGSAGAGGEVAKELGAGPWGQFLAALTAGLTPVAAKSLLSVVKNLGPESAGVKSTMEKIDLEGLSAGAIKRIKGKVDIALKNGDLDSAALKRMIDFELTGTTPTRASLTLDVIDKTQQKNLAKSGANSSNPHLQRLAQIEGSNNQTLLGNLDDLANNADLDPYLAGKSAINPVVNKRQGLIDTQQGLYKQANDSTGRSLPLQREPFIREVDEALMAKNLTRHLPKEVKNMINDISYGQIKVRGEVHEVPFTVDTMDSLKSLIATEQRSAKGSAKMALSAVRDALDNTQLQGGASDAAIQAFDKARAATFALKQWEKSSPAIKAIVDGATPETFMDKYIISKSASVDDVAKLTNEVKADPAAFNALKYQVAAWIRDKAAPNVVDGAGKLNSASLNRALKTIGDRKLGLFFSKPEVAQIKATNRVAFYEAYQPIGSAVNNSNTATTITGGLFNFLSDKSPTLRAMGTFAKAGDSAINDPGRAKMLLNAGLLKPNQVGSKGVLAAPLSMGLLGQ